MSISRTSGAMRMMTARQIATASFAVPKSVMNTTVGRFVSAAFGALSSAARGAHPAQLKAATTSTTPRLSRREVNDLFVRYTCKAPPIPSSVPPRTATKAWRNANVNPWPRIIADGGGGSKLALPALELLLFGESQRWERVGVVDRGPRRQACRPHRG